MSKGNSREGAMRAVETKRKKYGPDYFKNLTSKAGKASTHRPMRDPEYARRLAYISAQKRRERAEERKRANENGSEPKT